MTKLTLEQQVQQLQEENAKLKGTNTIVKCNKIGKAYVKSPRLSKAYNLNQIELADLKVLVSDKDLTTRIMAL